MKLTYKKLWKVLIDRDMKKGELRNKAHLSQSTMAKLAHDENVNTDTLLRICAVLNCTIDDISEIQYSESGVKGYGK